jgi:hypothetical protein
MLNQYGVRGKPLYNTENAILCGKTGKEESCQGDDFNTSKAYYLVQAYTQAHAEGLVTNIWYDLTGAWRATRLVNELGEPLPAFNAMQFNSKVMEYFIFNREVDIYPQISITEFIKKSERLWVAWSLNEATQEISFPSPPQAIFDIFGNPLPVQNTVSIDMEPIYIIWNQTP